MEPTPDTLTMRAVVVNGQQARRPLTAAAADPAAIVTREFGLDQVAEGFAAMKSGRSQRLPIMFSTAGGRR